MRYSSALSQISAFSKCCARTSYCSASRSFDRSSIAVAIRRWSYFPARTQERAVRDVLRQGVLEGVLGLREDPGLADQLEPDELPQRCLRTRVRLHDTVEKTTAERPSDHGGGLERALRRFRKAIDARRNDVLDRVGYGEVIESLRQHPAVATRPDAARLPERLDELLDEERVAFRLSCDQSLQAVGQALGGQHRTGHHDGISRRQRAGRDAVMIAALAKRM